MATSWSPPLYGREQIMDTGSPVTPPIANPLFGLHPAHLMGMLPQASYPAFGVNPAYLAGVIPPVAYPTAGIAPTAIPTMGVPPVSIPGMTPSPIPVSAPVSFLLAQISLREAAARLSDEGVKERVIANVNEAITRYIDDLAGVTLHPWFRGGPGALPWVYPIVSELALIAHTFTEGNLRQEVLNIASQILHKSITPMTGEEHGKRR